MSVSREHPAWYGAVMGTGATALVIQAEYLAWDVHALNVVAQVLFVLTTVLAVVLLPRYLRRFANIASLGVELSSPIRGAMLATLPAGLLLLGIVWSQIGTTTMLPAGFAYTVSAITLIIGAVLAVTMSVVWLCMMLFAEPGLENVNGGWLIPAVMNLFVPIGVSAFMPLYPDHAIALLALGLMFFGIGLVLFMVMLTLLVARLASRAPLPGAMVPTLWIPLAPAGLIGIALIRLLDGAQLAQLPGFDFPNLGVVVATMFVGFGFWWSAFASVAFMRLRHRGDVNPNPGWWGIVFPIGAMSLAVILIANSAHYRAMEYLGALAALATVWVWTYVSWHTFIRPPADNLPAK